ncbi:MAG: UDP-N-acetylmuramoyl-L-alanine--D-glutamate ligase [Clostridia bacterium]|nr:UDP-N-acetylmuramoyl-L-alanine--D-glutamate ligase [Clostridia bacterium]
MKFQNKKWEEFNEYIKFRKVAIIGLGVSNLPLLDYLYEKKAKVTVFDERNIEQIPKHGMDKIESYHFGFYLGKNCLENLNGFDIIFRSPSCLPTREELQKEEERGAILTTEIEMLMKMCPCKMIGVTGSDGKTTTTSLIHSILQKAGYRTFLGGNIGTPLFTKLSEMTPEDIVVLELSSFQLMGMEVSPDIAVITNITPNHLNIHKDYEEYIEAKKNIFRYQNEKGILVLNYDNEITKKCEKEAKGKVVFFSHKEKLENGFIVDDKVIKECEDRIRKHIMSCEDTVLRGEHNLENIATAMATTKTLVPIEKAIEAIKQFKPVEHRIEFVDEIDQVKWYNDSSSSSPTRTLSGLNAFDEEIVLIAGGYDKNLDYQPLAKPIASKVKTLLLIGQTSGKIFDVVKEELENQKKNLDIYMCESLEQTVTLARKVAKPGNVVLFSPASASFDMFKDFADRGNQFKDLVHKIKLRKD